MHRRLAPLLLIALLMVACKPHPDRLQLVDWRLLYQDHWHPVHTPSFIHTNLIALGAIPDPYYGTNEALVGWVADSVWVYRTAVKWGDMPRGDTLWLTFEGLAGRVTIAYGDDSRTDTLTHDNMFARAEIPLIHHHYSGDSLQISITFSPLDDLQRETDYGIPLPDRRAFTRIAPYQQGWDWGPYLPTCGIWKPAYITQRRTTTEINPPRPPSWNVELRQEEDSIGRSFTFYRDGKPLFVKGANWIPAHSFPTLDAQQRLRYRQLLTSAREAGFNMLRVWGGGIYEHDYFYDLCDSLGLMVWQDFNFSTMLYPDSPEMLASIECEVRENIARIAQHPCVVLWCGNNEVKNGWEDWGWQGVYSWSNEQRAHLEHSIDTLFGYSPTSNISSNSIIARAVAACDPLQRPYISTSPLYGWGHPECTTHGDSHYWGVWWGEEPFESYADKTGRFMSEYGFQSYPMLSTLRHICPADQLYIDSPTLQSHQKHPRGREIIDQAMRRYYGFDSHTLNLDDYAYVSQLLQAWGTGYGILQHLLHRPHCMGTLYWQLNDCWPVASWSSIDYYGNWKALHYRVRDLYADDADLQRWGDYYAVYPKYRHYEEPRYELQQRTLATGTLEAKVYAGSQLHDVYLDTEPHVDGHFSHNFFDLNTSDSIVVHFIPVHPTTDLHSVRITLRTLDAIMLHRDH